MSRAAIAVLLAAILAGCGGPEDETCFPCPKGSIPAADLCWVQDLDSTMLSFTPDQECYQ